MEIIIKKTFKLPETGINGEMGPQNFHLKCRIKSNDNTFQ